MVPDNLPADDWFPLRISWALLVTLALCTSPWTITITPLPETVKLLRFAPLFIRYVPGVLMIPLVARVALDIKLFTSVSV